MSSFGVTFGKGGGTQVCQTLPWDYQPRRSCVVHLLRLSRGGKGGHGYCFACYVAGLPAYDYFGLVCRCSKNHRIGENLHLWESLFSSEVWELVWECGEGQSEG